MSKILDKYKELKQKLVISTLALFTYIYVGNGVNATVNYTPSPPSTVSADSISNAIMQFYNTWILGLVVAAAVLGLAFPFFKMIISSNSASKRVEAKEAIFSVVIAVLGVVLIPQGIIAILRLVGA